ncbi:MAG: ammonium transporter [Spirochaetes bacterium]|nr:ammonium transporter [Spirochaetota bacterium]
MDFANTAWVLFSAALVLLMTLPALAFFYGGLVKRKNILSILMQCFMTLAVVSILWITVGYSLSFAPGLGGPNGVLAPFIGGFDWVMLKGITPLSVSPYTIMQPQAPVAHIAFIVFQMMFAVITPALIIGAFAERMKFTTYVAFVILWSLLVYFPMTHWVWGADGWLSAANPKAIFPVLDFAGGVVVHINAGLASLATAIIIGKRKNLKPTPPHNLPFTVLGAGLLWFGWFGFNAGSSLAADGLAANAFLVTNTSAAAAAIVWALLDTFFSKKPTLLGISTGAVAGLASITPASGFVTMPSALVIGIVASVICYIFVVVIKNKLGYDDALDAFGVHGVGGIWGSFAAGIFASPVIQPAYSGLVHGNMKQFLSQSAGIGICIVYAFVVTWIIYMVLNRVAGVRVDDKQEAIGLDLTQHNERGYTIVE